MAMVDGDRRPGRGARACTDRPAGGRPGRPGPEGGRPPPPDDARPPPLPCGRPPDGPRPPPCGRPPLAAPPRPLSLLASAAALTQSPVEFWSPPRVTDPRHVPSMLPHRRYPVAAGAEGGLACGYSGCPASGNGDGLRAVPLVSRPAARPRPARRPYLPGSGNRAAVPGSFPHSALEPAHPTITGSRSLVGCTGTDGRDPPPAPAGREHTNQVVPRTVGADLDDVADHRVRPPEQPVELGRSRRAPALCRQAWSEHVRDLDERGRFADRARLSDRDADVPCCSKELRMGVADVGTPQAPSLERPNHRVASQPVLDAAAVAAGGEPSDARRPELHGFRVAPDGAERAGARHGSCSGRQVARVSIYRYDRSYRCIHL